MPAALESLAVEREGEVPLRVGLVRIALGLPGAAIPDHHGAAAVLTRRYRALEDAVLDRMVLRLHREPLDLRIEARPFGDGPAQQHAVELEAEVVVEPARRVLLDDVREALSRPLLAARLRRAREVALAMVGREAAGAGTAAVLTRPRCEPRAA